MTRIETLDVTWRGKPGFYGWLASVDHKSIGKRFIVTAFVFFILGGLMAGMMRLQLARPDSKLLSPDMYNQVFTMHGTTMMFLFAVPVMQAMSVYLVPLMVGARAIAFPRMVAFAYWVYLFGGAFLYVGFLLNIGPDNGWFNYVPLSGPDYGAGKRSDWWAQLITFTEVTGILISISIIVTIFKLRAPGMSLNRVPLFAWASLVESFMIIFAMPAVVLASTMLITDRLVGTHIYNPAEGGDALLWQHLFWFFGHPEVYFIFIPALGFISPIIQTFSRRPIFGYPAMVLSLITTGFLSFGLWVHHMFATNVPELGKAFFTAMSMLIAIPTAMQIFCWIATIRSGRLVFRTPFLFILGFFFILMIGGLTGLILGSVPLDLQVHDTYFVVAHLHYVLIGGAVFPLFGAWYYWFPKITGRLMNERMGKWNFWLFFVGFNVTFYPMHHLGLMGMPRRVYTYPAEMGWQSLNLLASAGAVMIVASVLLFIINVVSSLRAARAAPADPWGAGSLEWATASPPPPYNFADIPVVHGREPLWEPPQTAREANLPSYVTGLADDEREILVTRVMDAQPDHRLISPEPTIWPFVSAIFISIMFVGSIFNPWAVVWGTIPVVIVMTVWFWPKHGETERHLRLEKAPTAP